MSFTYPALLEQPTMPTTKTTTSEDQHDAVSSSFDRRLVTERLRDEFQHRLATSVVENVQVRVTHRTVVLDRVAL